VRARGYYVQVRIAGPRSGFVSRWLATLLLVTGVACLAFFCWSVFEANYFQAELSHEFEEQRRQSVGEPAAPEQDQRQQDISSDQDAPGGAENDGPTTGLVGRLEIPRLGLDVMVLNGVEPATLRRSAGWLTDTSRPGKSGNVAIAAHRDTYFRPLRHIQEGDVIQITTLNGRYDYRVQWTAVVEPDDLSVIAPTVKPTLTLITCYPFYYVGNAPQRFVVRAGQQAVSPGGAD
jgi:sortase A